PLQYSDQVIPVYHVWRYDHFLNILVLPSFPTRRSSDLDFIVFATLSPDYYFPGPGVTLQKDLGIKTVGALDIRNQCSGFIYALSVADQFIKTGMYKNIFVVGSEIHSKG